MLRVTLHNCRPEQISSTNKLGRLDIGLEKIGEVADYKAVLFVHGFGECPMVHLHGYPRWSASVWDLVLRAACLSVNGEEVIRPLGTDRIARPAFAEHLTASIEDWTGGTLLLRSCAGLAHVAMLARGVYQARFEDAFTGVRQISKFTHRPRVMEFWNLLAGAYAWSFAGSPQLPPRPRLHMPLEVEYGDQKLIALHKIREPGRTGVQRWLSSRHLPTTTHAEIDGPCVTADEYERFLKGKP